MSLKRSSKTLKTGDKEKNEKRYNYVGDLNDNDVSDDIKLYLQQLDRRLCYIERALGQSNIIKATPIISLIYTDEMCKQHVNAIYDNWINYMNFISRYGLNGMFVNEAFWIIDKYIFGGFFENLSKEFKFEFINLSKQHISSYNELQLKVLTEAMSCDRDLSTMELKNVHDKEYISTLVFGRVIYIFYFESELSSVINNNNSNDNNDNNIQLERGSLHNSISTGKSIIGEVDLNSLNIQSNSNSFSIRNQEQKQQFQHLKDKRLTILGSRRTLYNNLVSVDQLNSFNSQLYGMGSAWLNFTVIIFHAMLHIKYDMKYDSNKSHESVCNNKRHSHKFLNEFIGFTPSVMYGHSMLPIMTLDDI